MSREIENDTVIGLRSVADGAELAEDVFAVGILACKQSHVRGLRLHQFGKCFGVFGGLSQIDG